MDRESRVEVIESYYDYVDAEEYDALFELFADDIVYHRPGQEPIEGIDEFRRFYREVRDIEDGEHAIHDVHVDGDTVVVQGQFTGVVEGSETALGFADVHQFDDGTITKRWSYTDQGRV